MGAFHLRGDPGHGLDFARVADGVMGGKDLRDERRTRARQADDEDRGRPPRAVARGKPGDRLRREGGDALVHHAAQPRATR